MPTLIPNSPLAQDIKMDLLKIIALSGKARKVQYFIHSKDLKINLL